MSSSVLATLVGGDPAELVSVFAAILKPFIKDLYEKGIIGQGNNSAPKPDDTEILHIPNNLDFEPVSLEEKKDFLDSQHIVLKDRQPSIEVLSQKEHQEIPLCVTAFPGADQSASEVLREDYPETMSCQDRLLHSDSHSGCDISQNAQQHFQTYPVMVHNNDCPVCEIMLEKSHDTPICLITTENNNNEPFCDVLKEYHEKSLLYPCTGFNNSRFFNDFSLKDQHEVPLCFLEENDKNDCVISLVNQPDFEYSQTTQDMLSMSYTDTYSLNGGDWGAETIIFCPFI